MPSKLRAPRPHPYPRRQAGAAQEQHHTFVLRIDRPKNIYYIEPSPSGAPHPIASLTLAQRLALANRGVFLLRSTLRAGMPWLVAPDLLPLFNRGDTGFGEKLHNESVYQSMPSEHADDLFTRRRHANTRDDTHNKLMHFLYVYDDIM